MILALVFATLASAAPYGGTFSRSCKTYLAKPSMAQRQLISRAATDRNYRLRHYLWYALPGSWIDFSEDQKALLRELVPAWVPPAKLGGADFFALHREFLGEIFERLHEHGVPCLEPWVKIPGNGEETKMPGGFNASAHVKLSRSLTHYLDPVWLKSTSLEEAGKQVRSGLFEPLLSAYTPPDPGVFAGCGIDLDRITLAAGNPGPDFSKHCEDPKNDWLGSSFSAPANPLYYEFSAVVVEVLAAWESAHGGGPANFNSELGRPAYKIPDNFEREVQARFSALTEERSKADRAKNLPADPAAERARLKEKLRGIEMSLSRYRWK